MGRGDLVPRIISKFSVQIKSDDGKEYEEAWPVNLSETGACIRIDHPLEAKSSVSLKLALGQAMQDTVVIDSEVVWIREDKVNQVYYCGIGFKQVSQDFLNRIRDYVQQGGKSLLSFFSEFPLFNDLSIDDCQELLRIVTVRELEKKEILYVEGTEVIDLQGLFIVESGLLNIYKGPDPREERHLAVVSPGQVFGEVTMVMDQPHSATVMAVNKTRLIQINKMGFKLLSRDRPELALKIMSIIAKVLASRLGRTTTKLFSPVQIS